MLLYVGHFFSHKESAGHWKGSTVLYSLCCVVNAKVLIGIVKNDNFEQYFLFSKKKGPNLGCSSALVFQSFKVITI